jgi:hypothetical protein
MYLNFLGDLLQNTLNSINLVQWYINVPLNAGVQCYIKAYICIRLNVHSKNNTNKKQ